MKLTDSDRIVHKQFSTYGQNAKEWLRKCALLLPEIDRRQIWKKRGCGSIYEYAAKVAGMSRASVDEALWILHKVEDRPELKSLIEEKGLRSVRPILSIITPETLPFWVEKARSMPINQLETYVKNYREELIHMNKSQSENTSQRSKHAERSEAQSTKEAVRFEVSPALARKLQQISKRADFENLLEKFVETVEAREQSEKPQAVATSSRHVPAKIDKFVEARTSGLCAYPGCKKKATSMHHTQRWALENVHDPDRLHLLCTAHERIAHRGLIENEEQSPEKWRLREYADPLERKAYIDSLVNLHRQK